MPSSSFSLCRAAALLLCWSALGSGAPVVTPLPPGVGLYLRGDAAADTQGAIRRSVGDAVTQAIQAGVTLQEVEFPPLLGGPKAKTALDDFSNTEVLDANRDWCMQFSVDLGQRLGKKAWLMFPDLKETELAREAWPGENYQACTLTYLEAAVEAISGPKAVARAWGTTFAKTMRDVGLVGEDALGSIQADDLSREEDREAFFPPEVQIAVQPGDGGPVEDWNNVESAKHPDATLVVVNGALDKLRGGYYAPMFFPALAKCVDRFYRDFEGVYVLKPIDSAGWLHRKYPEPWCVYAEVGAGQAPALVATLEERPSYAEAIQILRTRKP
uniref:DUF1995 domain-containing protein n=1 Tax=Pinguiococcus pyrenoidosus TaxID=172671 RepID=A0A7R9UDR3_9STRA|mmetsp:Transcript_6110/g.23753  ORF Transcript_6110/g.23753 Transcript_6110/m.23753 type:complete len:328 (+) Transcript_6110:124-1107(+)